MSNPSPQSKTTKADDKNLKRWLSLLVISLVTGSFWYFAQTKGGEFQAAVRTGALVLAVGGAGLLGRDALAWSAAQKPRPDPVAVPLVIGGALLALLGLTLVSAFGLAIAQPTRDGWPTLINSLASALATAFASVVAFYVGNRGQAEAERRAESASEDVTAMKRSVSEGMADDGSDTPTAAPQNE